ncbi:MAG: hypothetical protein Q8Q05_03530 [bacterium]|nr:hypothetical protein [bacterium]
MPEEPIEDLDDLSEARIPEETVYPDPGEEVAPEADQAQGIKDQYDQGKQTIEDIKGVHSQYKDRRAARADKAAAKKAGKEGLLKEGVEKQGAAAAQAARNKVTTQGAQQVAKAGVKTAATTGAKALGTAAVAGAEAAAGPVGWVLLATTILSSIKSFLLPVVKKYWPRVVLILSFMLLLPTMVFGLLGLKGTNITPATAGQYAQVQTTAYIAGDILARKAVTKEVVDRQKQRYKTVLQHVNETIPDKATEVKKAADEITDLLETAIGLSGSQRDIVIKQVNEKIRALDSTLPYGEWVAKEAEKYVGTNPTASKDFCRITRNSTPELGCASVVSVIMYDAGIPQDLTASQQAIWKNYRLQLLVSPLPNNQLSRDLYNQNKERLQRGDIVWWGNGVRRNGADVGLQGHIGIYIGNGLAVNNSSGLAEKAGEAVPVKSKVDRSDITFNGAKRYGK